LIIKGKPINDSDKLHRLNIPMLDGDNYTAWSSRMKIFLQGKKLFFACANRWDKQAPGDVKAAYLSANNKAILHRLSTE
jgi:hypothetical protein